MAEIFITEAAKICRINNRTFDKYVKKGLIKITRTLPPNFRLFDKAEIIRFAKRLPKKRRKGYSFLIKE